MDLPSADLLNDKQFKFVVGASRKEFMVHADVFANLSNPLHILIDGNFAEAATKTVVWDDVDETTFDRLRQFAYCGDYQGATPKTYVQTIEELQHEVKQARENRASDNAGSTEASREEDNQSHLEKVRAATDQHRNSVPEKRPRKKNKYRWKLPYSISNMYDDLQTNQTVTVTRKRTFDNFMSEAEHDGKALMARSLVFWFNFNQELKDKRMKLQYDKVGSGILSNSKKLLLCHADLHMLADRYCIDKLVEITAIKLIDLLFHLILTKHNIAGIAAVIHYVFQNTIPGDPIRDGLVRFGAVIIEDVDDNKDWTQMLHDTPEFSVGVIHQLVKHRLSESY
ncbi:hypothetical protein GGR53DRAFT_498041 [Hypoxylon sp. FL1150]|nr:hypothetical protein GGR53DRAFT_498041 [Hypoxylon sp. FL1150]